MGFSAADSTSYILCLVSIKARRRTAALLEVLGIYLAGPLLQDQVVRVLVHWHLISTENPFSLLTRQMSNADLVLASRQYSWRWS